LTIHRPLSVGLSVLFWFFIFLNSAFADKGVFSATASPQLFFTNTPTTVTVSAEIGAENLYISSVAAYKTTADGKPIAKLGQMYDDGSHGDARAADTIFTMQFDVNNNVEESIYVMVTAAYRGDRNRYLSQIMKIKVFNPLPVGTMEAITQELSVYQQNFYNYLQSMDIESARQQILSDVLANPNVSKAEMHENTISITFKNGLDGYFF